MRTRRIIAVASTAALIAGLGTAAFGVDDAKEVRADDFIAALSDTRTAGHVEFLEEGLHV